MRRRTRPPERPGFTIVELLVAMALIIFIMYILAEAFAAGAKAFRDLKAIGDMNEKLRSASSVLRRYLSADHFEGKKRLSDPNFWSDGPPKEGFFRIWQNSDPFRTPPPPLTPLDPCFYEGNDLDGNPSFRATDHGLHFTTRLRGNNRGDFFRGGVPGGSPLLGLWTPDSRFQDGNVFTSPWAEVAFYLKPTGETTDDPNALAGTTRLPLYALHMRQRLLVPDTADITGGPDITAYQGHPEISVTRSPPHDTNNASAMYFNSPADVTMPMRRFGYRYWQTNPGPDLPAQNTSRAPADYPTIGEEDAALAGSDVLLMDVISMEIRVLLGSESYATGADEFVHLFNPIVDKYRMRTAPTTPVSPRLPVNQAFPDTVRVFDTWSSRRDNIYDYAGWQDVPNPSPNPPPAPRTQTTIPMYRDPFANPAAASPIRIRAIQVILRVWDSNTKQTRQTSVIVDL